MSFGIIRCGKLQLTLHTAPEGRVLKETNGTSLGVWNTQSGESGLNKDLDTVIKEWQGVGYINVMFSFLD